MTEPSKPDGAAHSRENGASGSWKSETGFDIDPVYEGPGWERLGRPGEFPFARHIVKDGYRRRPWAPSIYSGFGTPADANARFRFLLAQGNGRVNVATDLPTQIGLDSDDPDAAGEVGRVGVAIDSLDDFKAMFDGVPLDRTAVSLNLNTVAPIFLAFLVATARAQGVELAEVRGTLANDILHEYIARGTWRYPPGPALRLMADVAEYAVEHMPNFYPFNIRSILLHESGGHPGQEIGMTFAIACRYVDELIARGLPVDSFAPRISFFFGTGLKLLEEVAKFRAARRLWARIMFERYGACDPASQKLRLTSVAPCGSHFTAADPELNLVRGTIGCLAGALGGVQAMLGTTIDEAYAIPTARTQHLALRTQQIVAIETDVCATADPLGGSWFIEEMTDRIEESARTEMEALGGPEGIVQAIADGVPQVALAQRSYQLEEDFQQGARRQVGVNIYPADETSVELEIHAADANLSRALGIALTRLRAGRDNQAVADVLSRLESVARSNENVMPTIVEAVELSATIGEISRAMDAAFGAYQQPVAI